MYSTLCDVSFTVFFFSAAFLQKCLALSTVHRPRCLEATEADADMKATVDARLA